jgi:hypothetical protein
VVAEKPVVSKAKPREAWMPKMPAGEPGPCEVHSPAHPTETHAPAHAAKMHSAAHGPMHSASHASTVHAAAAAESAAAGQRRRRKRDRRTKRTSYEAINELSDHGTSSVFGAPMRVNRRANSTAHYK